MTGGSNTQRSGLHFGTSGGNDEATGLQNRLQEISVILERCEYARCTVYKDKTTDSGTDGGKAKRRESSNPNSYRKRLRV